MFDLYQVADCNWLQAWLLQVKNYKLKDVKALIKSTRLHVDSNDYLYYNDPMLKTVKLKYKQNI